MNDQAVTVTVQILDSQYRIACSADNRASLVDSATYLNEKLLEIRAAGKVQGVDRVTVMAALNISHELLACKAEIAELNDLCGRRLQALLDKVEIALSKFPQKEV